MKRVLVALLILVVGLLETTSCSSDGSGGSSSPATTATPLTQAELAAFNDFVDNGTLLNQNGRRCIATPFLREYGIDKLQAFGAGTPLTQREAEKTYEMFDQCFDTLAMFDGLYSVLRPSTASRTAAQTRCLRENGPGESEAKILHVGLFQGTKISFDEEIRAKAQAALTKCIGPA
ncbi:MAG: hypothetical protein ABI658_18830 [Acidimicrobiales bacterium]